MAKGKLAQRKSDAKSAGWAHYIRNENDERAVLNGCRVEESLGLHVCEFFRRYLRHSKGEWAGQRFELTDLRFGSPGAGAFHCVAVVDVAGRVRDSWFTYGSGRELGWQLGPQR